MYLCYGLYTIAVLSQCVSAFFPYAPPISGGPGDDTAPQSRVNRRSPFYTWPVESDASTRPDSRGKRSNSRRASQRDVQLQQRNIEKREPAYTVIESEDPALPSSVAIDQEGTDFSYFVTVKVGSTGKELRMLVDTGAANTWVMGSECTTQACQAHTTFGPSDSTTLVETDNPWSVSYGTGTVSGKLVNDTMSLAGFEVPMTFGLASETSKDFLAYPMDGILGLGRSGSNELDVPTLPDVLAAEKKLKDNIIGINIQRHADGLQDGAINFGGIDTSKFEGDISWTDSVSADGLWEVEVESAGIGGDTVPFSGRTAIIDTGTSYILIPPDDAEKLHERIPNVKNNGETFQIPCSTSEPIQFTFSGITYDVSAKDYVGKDVGGGMCNSNIFGRQAALKNQWLLGDTFLKNVYSVFDFDKDRIGLAKRVYGDVNEESTPTSTSFTPSSASSTSAGPSDSSDSSTPSSTSEPDPGLLPPSQETGLAASTASDDGTPPSQTTADSSASASPESAAGRVGIPLLESRVREEEAKRSHACFQPELNIEDQLRGPCLLQFGTKNLECCQHNDAMDKSADHVVRNKFSNEDDEEEITGLLSSSSSQISDIAMHKSAAESDDEMRKSENRRTSRPNRVHFEIDDEEATHGNGHALPADTRWVDDEDFLVQDPATDRRDSSSQRAPLLTDIEAPSVTVATTDLDFNAEDLLESARPKSGMRSAFMNMANSIIGAGIIGQPYAFRQAGMLTGIILLVSLTCLVDWTIRLIVINSKLSGADSFQSTMEHCFGRTGLIAISVAQWAFAFGGMVAFCIIVGDSIPHVMVALFPSLSNTSVLWLLTNRQAVIIIFVLGVSYPLSLYRDIAKLAKASTLALISMLVILVTVITQGVRVPSEMRGGLGAGLLIVNSGVFQAIGVISFAFVCHHNSLLIYGSLKKPTMDRFARVTHYSTGISMVACMIMALSGFLTFGDKTQGNVLNNFPADNIMVNIARFCFGLNMLTTLPLEAFVCREVMTHYYFPNEPWNPHRHLIFSSALVVSAMALSLITCDLGAVFELIGATSACALAYILPPLCYIKLSSRSWKTVAAGACVGFGTCVMGISLVQAVLKIIRNEGGAHKCS
ncbi:MAG: hypothetical protein M1825_006315 [Sarcosagium campestre]|nr:MAG: hypothetical protein M1825_006315 [Sarcosagium campestre]